MKKIALLAALLFLTLGPAHAFTLTNFDTPESFITDPQDGAYYVSNINGDMMAKDGNGYISKISAKGNLVIQKFIGGKPGVSLLDAPKGLVILGRELYVTDIDAVKIFNKKTGKLIRTVDLAPLGAKFLNDLTDDGRGALYVTDTIANRIFKIDTTKNNEPSLFVESLELGGPNGIKQNLRSKNLMVVSWSAGQLLEVDRLGGVHVLKRGLTTLDGIDYDHEGNLYVSSFEKGEIYKISYWGRGPMTTFMSGLVTPSDISCDRFKKEILIPSFKGNSVTILSLTKKKE